MNWYESSTRRQLVKLGFCRSLNETYYDAALRQYRAHLTACLKQGIQPEPFERIASEILTAESEAIRVSLLTPDAPRQYEPPFMNYQQYASPNRNEAGQSTVEYLLLLVLVAGLSILLLSALGHSIDLGMKRTAGQVIIIEAPKEQGREDR